MYLQNHFSLQRLKDICLILQRRDFKESPFYFLSRVVILLQSFPPLYSYFPAVGWMVCVGREGKVVFIPANFGLLISAQIVQAFEGEIHWGMWHVKSQYLQDLMGRNKTIIFQVVISEKKIMKTIPAGGLEEQNCFFKVEVEFGSSGKPALAIAHLTGQVTPFRRHRYFSSMNTFLGDP